MCLKSQKMRYWHIFTEASDLISSSVLWLFCWFHWEQIHNRWKLQSIEQQQKEVQAKRQAKEQAKKAQGTNNIVWCFNPQQATKRTKDFCNNPRWRICLTMYMLPFLEERKKTKQSYQESLENVRSVRHQVMVSNLYITNSHLNLCLIHFT